MPSNDFQTQLAELRTRIDTLPDNAREPLLLAAAKIERQHARMQRDCATIANSAADIGLIVEHTKFEVAAIQNESRRTNTAPDPRGRRQR